MFSLGLHNLAEFIGDLSTNANKELGIEQVSGRRMLVLEVGTALHLPTPLYNATIPYSHVMRDKLTKQDKPRSFRARRNYGMAWETPFSSFCEGS